MFVLLLYNRLPLVLYRLVWPPDSSAVFMRLKGYSYLAPECRNKSSWAFLCWSISINCFLKITWKYIITAVNIVLFVYHWPFISSTGSSAPRWPNKGSLLYSFSLLFIYLGLWLCGLHNFCQKVIKLFLIRVIGTLNYKLGFFGNTVMILIWILCHCLFFPLLSFFVKPLWMTTVVSFHARELFSSLSIVVTPIPYKCCISSWLLKYFIYS